MNYGILLFLAAQINAVPTKLYFFLRSKWRFVVWMSKKQLFSYPLLSYILTNSCNVSILFSKLVLTPVGVSVKQVCIGEIYFLIKKKRKKRKHSCYYSTFLAELQERRTNHAVHWGTLRDFSQEPSIGGNNTLHSFFLLQLMGRHLDILFSKVVIIFFKVYFLNLYRLCGCFQCRKKEIKIYFPFTSSKYVLWNVWINILHLADMSLQREQGLL